MQVGFELLQVNPKASESTNFGLNLLVLGCCGMRLEPSEIVGRSIVRVEDSSKDGFF